LANSALALAEPDPLTLANLTTKSLTLLITTFPTFCCDDIRSIAGAPAQPQGLLSTAACGPGHRYVEKKFAHVPGSGRAALGAQAAMQATVLIFDHDAPGLQRIADIEVLVEVEGGGHQATAQFFFAAVVGEGDAVHRADIDAGVAFDAQLAGEHG